MHALGPYSELVLASTSPARKALLETLGLPFRCVAPKVDEEVPDGLSVKKAALMLAERKAMAVARQLPNALVLGSDQIVNAAGRALGKPKNADAALAQLRSLSGRKHTIVTAVCAVGPGFFACDADSVQMTLYSLKPEELTRYVATGEWEGCAGAYRIEGKGQALFAHVDGDRTSVQGLPMALVVRLLREANVELF